MWSLASLRLHLLISDCGCSFNSSFIDFFCISATKMHWGLSERDARGMFWGPEGLDWVGFGEENMENKVTKASWDKLLEGVRILGYSRL